MNNQFIESTLRGTPKAKKKRAKITCGGFTITVKARRLLTDDLVVKALHQAIDQVVPSSTEKRAA